MSIDWNEARAAWLAMPAQQLERAQRVTPRIIGAIRVAIRCIYVVTWLFAAYTLYSAALSDSFGTFWSAWQGHLAFTAAFLGIGYGLQLVPNTLEQAVALRHAVFAGDGSVAPVSIDQPQPLDAADIAVELVQIRGLERIEAPSGRPRILAGILVLFGVPIFAGCAFLLATLGDSNDLQPVLSILIAACGAFTVLCLPAGILLLLLGRRSLAPLVPAADDWGIAWWSARVPRRRLHIAWHQARAFFKVSPGLLAGHNARTVYVLDGDESVLAWAVPAKATAREREASDYISRLIVTRTPLALRAISPDFVPETALAPRESIQPSGRPATGWIALWRIVFQDRLFRITLAALGLSIALGLVGLLLQHLPS